VKFPTKVGRKTVDRVNPAIFRKKGTLTDDPEIKGGSLLEHHEPEPMIVIFIRLMD
jgi:hypothetical protein